MELRVIPEKDYNGEKALNFSRIKDFYKLGLFKYKKKYILGLEVKDPDSASLVVGSAADCILFEGQEVFDKRFVIGENQKIPTGKGGIFVGKLYSLLKEDMPFDTAFVKAYQQAELSEKLFESFTEKFENSELSLYLQNLREAEGKTAISVQDVAAANKIVETLKNHSRTRLLFDMDGYSQLAIVFEYNGRLIKCKLDKVLVDKKNKILKPFDLKCFFSVNDFGIRFTKDLYYIQQAIYTLAIEAFRDKYYPDYAIDDFKFCVSHNANLDLPVIYTMKTPKGDLYEGFTTESGRRYKGLDEMLFEIDWHHEHDIWNTTYELHNNRGQKTVIL